MMAHLGTQGRLVDVHSPEEFRGERLHMPDYPQKGAMRGGHITGAKNLPWARAAKPETGDFAARTSCARSTRKSRDLRPETT